MVSDHLDIFPVSDERVVQSVFNLFQSDPWEQNNGQALVPHHACNNVQLLPASERLPYFAHPCVLGLHIM